MTDLDNMLSEAFEALLGTTRDKTKHPKRWDFDVPLPADCKAWLARITRKHHRGSAQ